MLPFYLRALLVLGAIAALYVVVAVVFVVIAVFPDIAINLAYALGFMSASNFVYLVIIALLLWKAFTNSAEISRLRTKVNELAQEIALSQKDD